MKFFGSSSKLFFVSLSLCSLMGLLSVSVSAASASAASSSREPGVWAPVDQLISEQKLQAALDKTLEILASVKTPAPAKLAAEKAPQLWTQALIRATQLQLGLHGYETSVRFLMEQDWPKNNDSRAILNLYYAAALMHYQSSYGWEIGKREKTILNQKDSRSKIDLKAWTTEQIGNAIGQAFDKAMEESSALSQPMPEFYAQFFQKNNYPKGVRPTLRDTIVYMAVQHLANSVYWNPQQSNEIYKLPLAQLVVAEPKKRISAADESVHPLIRLASWLSEHRDFHLKGYSDSSTSEGAIKSTNRSVVSLEAALEAHYELLFRLHQATNEEGDRSIIRQQLREIQRKNKSLQWWARGQAYLADFIMAENRPGKLIDAREEALKGQNAFPGTPGGEICRSIVANIEYPSFNLSVMATDGPGKTSLLLNYKNIEKIYFRAYAFDLDARLKEKRNGSFMYLDNFQEQIKDPSNKILLEWSESLQKTTDFATHRAILTPKINQPGQYIIVAATRPDFSGKSDQVVGVQMSITDLFLLTTSHAQGGVEARLLSAALGLPVKGAQLELYKYQWNKAPEKAGKWNSNAEGFAQVKAEETSGVYWNYFLLGRKDSQLVSQNEGLYFYKSERPPAIQGAFIFTDRSIYRPLQKILWKAVLYSGDSDKGQFLTAKPGTALSIQLVDPNGEVVAQKKLTVNQFGTVSGEFEIPSGRLLGSWRLMVNNSYNLSSNIRVEEYKRPTFTASFQDSKVELKLNQKAKLIGEAKYYFGLPVSGGKVQWRVTRQEVTPWWWSYWGGGFDFQYWRPGRARQAQIVASGSSTIQSDGSFEIEFLPEADQRLSQSEGLSYNFIVNADVTDEGGETRSAQRNVRLGFVSVEASLYWKKGFFTAGEPIEIESRRSSLSGEARKGKGQYRVVRLEQPRATPLPSELPVDASQFAGFQRDEAADLEKHATKDDRRRARWETTFNWTSVTRQWKEGAELLRGEVEHLVEKGEDGRGKIKIPAISETGVYRIFYQTSDESGGVFKVSRDFVVGSNNTNLSLPLFFEVEDSTVEVGQTAKFLVHSGFNQQYLTIDIYKNARLIQRKSFIVGKDPAILELPIQSEDRGGFSVYVYGVRDYQLFSREISIDVPWTDKNLDVSFSTFRDKMRPGSKEKFTIKLKDFKGQNLEKGGAELLAYMYDRSLDLFTPHFYQAVSSVYPRRTGVPGYADSLRQMTASYLWGSFGSAPGRPAIWADRLNFYPSYGVGGPGVRGAYRGRGGYEGIEADGHPLPMSAAPALAESAPLGASAVLQKAKKSELSSANISEERKAADSASTIQDKNDVNRSANEKPETSGEPSQEIRRQFAETGFFKPHLILGADSSVSFEFDVPDSVTSWNVYAHALTKDMRGGSGMKRAETIKELMVRPYIPRFLRETDAAEIKVLVNNASENEISGDLSFDIEDLETGKSVLAEFGIKPDQKAETKAGSSNKPKSNLWQRSFKVAKKGSVTLAFPVKAPQRVGLFAVRVLAKTENFSDGELRPIPVLPSRMRLAQSRFVTLKNSAKKTMEFPDLLNASNPTNGAAYDSTLQNEKMVVTIDGQLFFGVLQSLPYLIKYPYECIEQTMNRFLSTGIVSSVFKKFPAVAEMAKEFSQRKTAVEKFDAPDANQRMQLEESPWFSLAKGGQVKEEDLVNVLDSRLAAQERDRALQQIEKMQLPSGAWPWFAGGPPDQYMTLYVLMGFSRALEFKMDVPKPVAVKAWSYLKSWLDSELQQMMSLGCCHETITYLNFVLSSYPDESWTGGLFNEEYRRKLLEYSFLRWKSHSPLLKGYLALTLHRMKRSADAKLVWDSVLDSAKNTDELGTYWAAESRSWLWYNDTVETQAFALRTLMELDPANKHNEGLVQWLFLNKKLNHWKSTKATAEAIYSLVHYLDKNAALGAREVVKVDWGTQKTEFIFEPNKYTGKKNQIVLEADRMDPNIHSKVIVEKQTPGFAFASAVWHFSTEKLPTAEKGDFFNVSRKYFKRTMKGNQWSLSPLSEGTLIQVGDQIEVQISLSTKHEAEYVHLRDPRAAGMEPESLVSGYKSDLGIFWYEEIRDSGQNFFFSRLPVGEYNFRYRLRANMAGRFRIGPATVQSIYAPEFNAYSKGDLLSIQ